MAARLPVVCSGFANLGISATPGEHLLIAENPGDYARLASQLVSDPDGAKRLAESAYAWVSATQSQAAFARRLLESVDKMLQRAR
jgi:spore maturation protein CgeB